MLLLILLRTCATFSIASWLSVLATLLRVCISVACVLSVLSVVSSIVPRIPVVFVLVGSCSRVWPRFVAITISGAATRSVVRRVSLFLSAISSVSVLWAVRSFISTSLIAILSFGALRGALRMVVRGSSGGAVASKHGGKF